jgi:hypothetical protein
VFCQLETLRHAVQPNVRRILEKLPKTLDETYERVLKNINENNQEHARRLLHCLAVSVRPLHVEELAEILTFEFDAAEGSTPKFHPDRRPRNPEHTILSICSSLITIAGKRGSRVVQFSHPIRQRVLDVKSSRVFYSTPQLIPHPSRTRPHHPLRRSVWDFLSIRKIPTTIRMSGSLLCLSMAARHWVTHAQFEDVASRMMKGLEILFDPDQPHFAAWIDLYDIGRRI